MNQHQTDTINNLVEGFKAQDSALSVMSEVDQYRSILLTCLNHASDIQESVINLQEDVKVLHEEIAAKSQQIFTKDKDIVFLENTDRITSSEAEKLREVMDSLDFTNIETFTKELKVLKQVYCPPRKVPAIQSKVFIEEQIVRKPAANLSDSVRDVLRKN